MSARSCHFGGVYTRQVWKSRSVQFLKYSGMTRHTDRHYSKPFTVTLPKGEGQRCRDIKTEKAQEQDWDGTIAT